MDPNNNQPIGGTNPAPQTAVQQPVNPPVPAPAAQPVVPISPQPISPQNVAETPKKGGGKRIILIVLILILLVGIGIYILFAKNQLNNIQKTTTTNTSSILPSPTAIPTLEPEDDFNIESPEADLLELDADVKGL